MEELPVIACSLTTAQLPERRRRWEALPLVERAETAHGVQLVFRAGPGVEEELRELAGLERECCGFARFEISSGEQGVTVDVTSSGDGVTAVRELFL